MKTWIAAFCLILIHAAVLWQSIQHKSASVDELSHLAAGLYSLSTGDFRMNRTAPPLQNIACALPVLLTQDVHLHYEHESWRNGIWNGSGDRLLEANPDTFHSLLQTGRIGTIFLSCLLCVLIYIWSKEIWGAGPALFVLLVAAFEPNLMAHGRLTTTDTAPVLCFTLTGYVLWKFFHKPSLLNLIKIGISFGLTWYAKHSGILLLPALFICFCIASYRNPSLFSFLTRIPKYANPFMRVLVVSIVSMLFICVIGLFVIWAGYGFEIGDSIHDDRSPNQSYIWSGIEIPLRTGLNMLGYDDPLVLDSLDPQQPMWLFLRSYLPAFSHWEGYFSNRAHLSVGHLGFFMGELSSYGWLLYYPVLFLIKTPTGLAALLALGVLMLAARIIKLDLLSWLSLSVIPVIYLLIIVFFNTANIGYRHALPVLPFMLILFGGASFRFMIDCIQSLRRQDIPNLKLSKPIRLLIAIMIVSCVGLQFFHVARQHPHYLSYFNTMIGGPKNGHHYAVDSNLDWGQDLLYIKNYLEINQITDAKLLYFGPPSLPNAYHVPHINAKELPEFDAGTYIVSASLLQGIGAGKIAPRLSIFHTREPDTFITPAVLVYTLP